MSIYRHTLNYTQYQYFQYLPMLVYSDSYRLYPLCICLHQKRIVRGVGRAELVSCFLVEQFRVILKPSPCSSLRVLNPPALASMSYHVSALSDEMKSCPDFFSKNIQIPVASASVNIWAVLFSIVRVVETRFSEKPFDVN